MGAAGARQAVALWGHVPARGTWAFAPPQMPLKPAQKREEWSSLELSHLTGGGGGDSPRLNAMRLVLVPALHLVTMSPWGPLI